MKVAVAAILQCAIHLGLGRRGGIVIGFDRTFDRAAIGQVKVIARRNIAANGACAKGDIIISLNAAVDIRRPRESDTARGANIAVNWRVARERNIGIGLNGGDIAFAMLIKFTTTLAITDAIAIGAFAGIVAIDATAAS